MTKMLGGNRTGAALAPERLHQMLEATEEFGPDSAGDDSSVARVRVEYAKHGDPAGTMPPPAGVKALARTAAKAVTGAHPLLFLDKLGERLAFECSGVRLYQALASKHDAYGSFRGGPSRADLDEILEEEHAHFLMLRAAVERLGGDPTAVTPSANVHATMSAGIAAVLADPRFDLIQSLEGALLAELADNDCWTALVALARHAGEDELVAGFEEAERHEREHLARVRSWVAAAQERQNGRAAGTPPPPGAQDEHRTRRTASSRSRSRKRATARAARPSTQRKPKGKARRSR